ncbi:MAG TPA: dihydroorotate dehydrogenase electron transfer subunit [Myxococcota bacterium]|nr:dihydroorotate dehydrogenase electron transfer subunit [Myxococcota bacterium]
MAVPAPIRVDAQVASLSQEGVASWRLRLRVPDWPGFEPGQFVMLSPGPRGAAPRTDPLLPRPMAVYRERRADGEDRAGSLREAEIEILFKRHGRGTALLASCAPGDRVGVVGPLGHGFAAISGRALLVAGGTGIASVYELAARLERRAPGSARVLLGARSGADLMGVSDFEALGVGPLIATEDGSLGKRGLVTDLLEAELARDASAHVYACGPTAMMRRCAEIAASRGAPCSASLENPMACGFGVCLGCAAPLRAGGFALVCRDGPVFDAAAIAWEVMP